MPQNRPARHPPTPKIRHQISLPSAARPSASRSAPHYRVTVELTPIRYFRAVAQIGHITNAAAALGITQPTLSAAIAKLERELGTPLFHRTAKGVELTTAGQTFLHHAEESLAAADAATQAVRELVGLERGLIRIGGGATAISHLLPPAVSAFRAAHPGVRFYIREAGSAAVARAVATGELDLGIVTTPVPGADAQSLLIKPLITDELMLIVPAGHPLASRKTFRWNDLTGQTMVAFEAGSAIRNVIDGAIAAAGGQDTLNIEIAMELRSIDAIRRMVAAGVGIGFISASATTKGDHPLRCKDAPITRELALIHRADRTPNEATSAFELALSSAR